MFANDYIDQTEQDKQSVNYLLRDGNTIDVFRSQVGEMDNAGFEQELTNHTKIKTIVGRIDPKGDKWIGLTDWLDCQVNDIWRMLNVRDDMKNWRVTGVKPRIGGCQVELKRYAKGE